MGGTGFELDGPFQGLALGDYRTSHESVEGVEQRPPPTGKISGTSVLPMNALMALTFLYHKISLSLGIKLVLIYENNILLFE